MTVTDCCLASNTLLLKKEKIIFFFPKMTRCAGYINERLNLEL